jgi:hypothetical protein
MRYRNFEFLVRNSYRDSFAWPDHAEVDCVGLFGTKRRRIARHPGGEWFFTDTGKDAPAEIERLGRGAEARLDLVEAVDRKLSGETATEQVLRQQFIDHATMNPPLRGGVTNTGVAPHIIAGGGGSVGSGYFGYNAPAVTYAPNTGSATIDTSGISSGVVTQNDAFNQAVFSRTKGGSL